MSNNIHEVFRSSSDRFANLFNNERGADVQFLVEEQIIYGHSLILSQTSPVFEQQFEYTENDLKLIPLPSENYDVVYSFIEYLYTDNLQLIRYENCFDLLKLALKYQTYDLEQQILAYICRNTQVRNTLEHFDYFVYLNYPFMVEHFRCMIAELLKFYVDLEQFLHIGLLSVKEILSITTVFSDVNVYEITHAVMKWGENKCVEHDMDKAYYTRAFFGEAVNKFKFTSMTLAQFSTFMNLYPNFFTDAEIGALMRRVTKKDNTNIDEMNCDFTMESYTKKPIIVGTYAHLQGGTRERRLSLVTLLDENALVINKVQTNVMMLNQYAYPIKFRNRVILEPNRQYQIVVEYKATNCGVAQWNDLQDEDIVGESDVQLVRKCPFIRKIHFQNILYEE